MWEEMKYDADDTESELTHQPYKVKSEKYFGIDFFFVLFPLFCNAIVKSIRLKWWVFLISWNVWSDDIRSG